jgi:lipopolysaccharide export system protein LptA
MGLLLSIFLATSWGTRLRGQDIAYEPPALHHSVKLSSKRAKTWKQGAYDAIYLAGNVSIRQGEMEITANEALVFVHSRDDLLFKDGDEPDAAPAYKALILAEGLVEVMLPSQRSDGSPNRLVDAEWFGRMYTDVAVEIPVDAQTIAAEDAPEIVERLQAALENSITPRVLLATHTEAEVPLAGMPQDGPAPGSSPQQVINPLTGEITTIYPQAEEVELYRPAQDNQPQTVPSVRQGASRGQGTTVDIVARDSVVDFNLRSETSKTNPNERLFIGTGGVRVTIDSPDIRGMDALRNDGGRVVVILADNLVAWQSTQYDGSSTWELYLEGNVVFSKGTRTIFADQMYYDATRSRGTILNADMLTPVQRYEGLVRMKAKVIEQIDQDTLAAYGAAFTTSRMGVPRYWLQSDAIEISRSPAAVVDNAGRPMFDPQTGELQTNDEYIAESRNNFLYVADRPVFYWPRNRTNLSDPGVYLEQFRIANDRMFGFQVHTAWNMHQLLGVRNRPENTRWLGLVDYLSERGLGFGAELDYSRQSWIGLPGDVDGYYRSWFIRDSGTDRLGRGRLNLEPEKENRGNILLRQRNRFEPGYSLRSEIGFITDRNFLEQYYQRRWDTEKDYTTGLWLERNVGTQSFNVLGNYQVNEFFSQTSWLPRADHFVIGQPLFNGRLTYHAHSHIGYARFREATSPLDPADLLPFSNLAWETPKATGVRAGTRHQIEAPFQLGPLKVIPYGLGDATYWQQDLNQDDMLRGYGQVGIRTSLPFWKVDPTVQSILWNVNGLAHKVTLESDMFFADASQDLDRLPLYDPLDDDSQEAFRRRLAFNSFGLPPGVFVPMQYDERYFALRRGMQNWVAAPSAEIADDLAVMRFGANQRWQTKRGMPGQERIIDWVTLNTHVTLFPNADRDNFGQEWGMFNYDFSWFLGDRVSILSDGHADFFSQGLRTASLGLRLGRPENGSVYFGYRSIEGPISSNLLNAALVYRMSDKWGIRANAMYDLSESGTLGNSVNLVYIGESFLWRFGTFADFNRENYTFQFGIEPRFLNRPRMFRPGNVAVGPAGSRWLE